MPQKYKIMKGAWHKKLGGKWGRYWGIGGLGNKDWPYMTPGLSSTFFGWRPVEKYVKKMGDRVENYSGGAYTAMNVEAENDVVEARLGWEE